MLEKKIKLKIIELQSFLHYCKDTCKILFYENDLLMDFDKEIYTESDSDEEESEEESDDN